METECFRVSAVIKEDFQALIRCKADIQVPKGEPRILSFYQKTAEAAIRWCREFLGERAKREYTALPDVFAKARFLPYRFSLRGNTVFEDAEYYAVVCEATFSRGNRQTVRRTAQVWNKREKTILPPGQVLRLFGGRKMPKQRGIRIDGCYPENGRLILFHNANRRGPFAERKLQVSKKQK